MRGRAVTGATHGADRLNRAALSLFGLLLLGIGGYGLTRGWRAFGDNAAAEPLLVGSWRDFVSRNQDWFWPVAAVISLLVGLLGVRWLRGQLAPASPDGVDLTHRGDGGTTVVRPAGAAQALANEIETYRWVTQASARLTGTPDAPEVDVRVEVTDDCNLPELRTRIDDNALTHLEQALELEALNAKVEFRLTDPSGRQLR